MRISKIQIQNFRSIPTASIELGEFNVFVGQNNHGKTNLFEAVDWFYSGAGDPGQLPFGQNREAEVTVEVEYTGVQEGILAVKNDKTRESFKKFANERDTIRVRRRLKDGKRNLFDETSGAWTDKNFAGFDKSFNDCLPRLEYVSTAVHLADVSKYSKRTPIGLMLSGVLTAILDKSPRYAEFRKKFDDVFGAPDSEVKAQLIDLGGRVRVHLQQQFPDCKDITFDVTEPVFEDLLKNFGTSVDDGIRTSAEEKGDGMQRALMLAIIKTYSDYRRTNDELGKRFVFLIDEAELHLHPTAQRQLKTALLKLAEAGDQVLINTHSSVLMVDDPPTQRLFQVVKVAGTTTISPVSPEQKPDIVFELLGGSPADLLFPQNFLIVEGKSEQELLSSVIQRFYVGKPRLQIIWAGGDAEKQRKSMDAINTAFVPLNQTPVYRDRLVLLLDQPNADQQAEYQKFRKKYAALTDGEQVFLLPVPSLEEYYPTPWQKTAAQVVAMKGRDKVALARECGANINQDQFEKLMPLAHRALKKAWEKAHS